VIHPPVTTEGGERIRRLGLTVLTRRYHAVLERGKRRSLTSAEKDDVRRTSSALEELQRMAPQTPLLPMRSGGWLFDVPTELEADAIDRT